MGSQIVAVGSKPLSLFSNLFAIVLFSTADRVRWCTSHKAYGRPDGHRPSRLAFVYLSGAGVADASRAISVSNRSTEEEGLLIFFNFFSPFRDTHPMCTTQQTDISSPTAASIPRTRNSTRTLALLLFNPPKAPTIYQQYYPPPLFPLQSPTHHAAPESVGIVVVRPTPTRCGV